MPLSPNHCNLVLSLKTKLRENRTNNKSQRDISMSRHPNIHVSGLILTFSILASCNETFATKSIAAHDALPDAPISDIDDYARHFVDAIQPISFEESREYCGFFIETPEGNVRGTRPIAGSPDSCSSGFIPINAIAASDLIGTCIANEIVIAAISA